MKQPHQYRPLEQQPQHDACGIGAVVNISGQRTHETLDGALKIVEKLAHRTGTHHTRFHSDIQSTFIQVFPAQGISRSCDSLHFGMSCNIIQCFCQIMPTTNDAVTTDYHRPHRNFSLFSRFYSLHQGLFHIIGIICHLIFSYHVH